MKRRWVWVARQAESTDNPISVLACAETIASVSVFLYFIAAYDWGIGVLVGAFITPIFFLRSPESKKSTKAYFERAVSRPHRFQLYGALIAYWLFSMNAPIWVWVAFMPCGLLAVGHLYNAWYVQFGRSLFYSREGITHLPQNYFETLFTTDITTIPEMFPESEGVAAIPQWKYSIFYFPHPRNPFTFLLSTATTLSLVGVVLLRLVAKASALIYLPLIYLSWPSRLKSDVAEQMIWIKSQSAKSIELFRLIFACLVVASLIASIFDTTKFWNASVAPSDDNPISMVATLYFITDLSDVKLWQWLSVISASISIALYFLMDGCRREAIAGRKDFSWRVNVIIKGHKVRTLLLISWIIVVGYYTLNFYYFECKIEGLFADILGHFWGKLTCVALPPK